ncbi:sigma factor [Massilia sp. DJPM01]|uniref:RNA polymerase sigma factor n=1 Tax=Massilia sp. DJPM01 TaxID=3024404 RepID=UPI00259D5438|nr:sigma factor [Massilia sp. DJPM01]MDM5175774.1 sigma factor [Massilia sp. DJPM01]
MQGFLCELTCGASRSAADGVGHAGLAHLFRHCRHPLVGFVMRYTGCHEEAEDVVQAAFVQVMSGAGDRAPQRTLPASLFGTALLLPTTSKFARIFGGKLRSRAHPPACSDKPAYCSILVTAHFATIVGA